MTHAELLSIAGISLVTLLFVLMVLGIRRHILLVLLVNSLLGMLIYDVLLVTSNISDARYHPLAIGVLGMLYIFALPFL